jgi:hypothetical protein
MLVNDGGIGGVKSMRIGVGSSSFEQKFDAAVATHMP